MLTEEEVKKIAKLARLEITADEVELYRGKLDAVLSHVEDLNQVDVSGVSFFRHIAPDAVAFREDREIASTSQKEILSNAPQVVEDHFSIPKVMDNG